MYMKKTLLLLHYTKINVRDETENKLWNIREGNSSNYLNQNLFKVTLFFSILSTTKMDKIK
jgi:hypothetical protein